MIAFSQLQKTNQTRNRKRWSKKTHQRTKDPRYRAIIPEMTRGSVQALSFWNLLPKPIDVEVEVEVAAVVDPADTLLAPVCTALLLVPVSETLLLAPVSAAPPLVVAVPTAPLFVTAPALLKLPTEVVAAACVIV